MDTQFRYDFFPPPHRVKKSFTFEINVKILIYIKEISLSSLVNSEIFCARKVSGHSLVLCVLLGENKADH